MSLLNERGEDYAALGGLVTYEADWYSGSQIQVFMGDILIDNAVHIGYQVRADSNPVYGFGSEYFAFVAKAPVLITGQLTIAFKESYYLLGPAARFHNRARVNNVTTTPRYSPVNPYIDGDQRAGFQTLEAASAAARYGKVLPRNVEQDYIHIKSLRQGGEGVSAGLITQLGALNDSEWENAAEVFEDAIWYGSDIQSPDTRQQLFSNTMSNNTGKINEKTLRSHRRLDQYPAVDIWITYGDMEAPDTVNHTVQKILDVYFTGEVKEIQADGQPVLETYTFIARNRV